MMIARLLTLPLFCVSLATPGYTADFSDPTWPCIQRKVERLSLGLMWVHPVPESLPKAMEARRDISKLAGRLALRKLDLESLKGEVAAFADKYEGDAGMLGLVFADVFNSLANRRSRIIDGIGDFSLSQIALSEKIEQMRQDMRAEMDKESPDFDRVDSLEEQLDWDQLIFTDRQQSITYLCETPVLLERRLYGVAQLLQAQVRDDS
ncbi:hypothetical protein [Roseovarius aestuariivivens]|uniref:hypothetical protein n=1 Tax=Roseovarius aestuariivivens TaxID=1888910 RepID=UPI001081360A|nr:hypothetical protein [Roseovarius aestuariivivens]